MDAFLKKAKTTSREGEIPSKFSKAILQKFCRKIRWAEPQHDAVIASVSGHLGQSTVQPPVSALLQKCRRRCILHPPNNPQTWLGTDFFKCSPASKPDISGTWWAKSLLSVYIWHWMCSFQAVTAPTPLNQLKWIQLPLWGQKTSLFPKNSLSQKEPVTDSFGIVYFSLSLADGDNQRGSDSDKNHTNLCRVIVHIRSQLAKRASWERWLRVL